MSNNRISRVNCDLGKCVRLTSGLDDKLWASIDSAVGQRLYIVFETLIWTAEGTTHLAQWDSVLKTPYTGPYEA